MTASKKRSQNPQENGLPVVHRHAAGIDVGATFHVVAVEAERDPKPVRSFRSFTGDLHCLADWLTKMGITTVAMESTGVYWIPVFEILEARGFEVLLVNARDVKNVPGRKTDVNDAQWIQRLHQHGLLRGSFRPRQELVALRAYLRHRERMVEYAAAHVPHMPKALMQMNLQLHHVVSDITGVTGMRIIRAILDGERDPEVLGGMRDVRCKESRETISNALVGNYRPEHLFALQQALELNEVYQERIRSCDRKIEETLRELNQEREAPAESLAARRSKRQKNEPAFDIQSALQVLLGVDPTRIHGIGPYLALRLVAECGDDMSRWPTVKHFTSWLTLSPGNKISGGRVLSSKTRRSANRAAALLRMSAISVGKTNTALGAFYRRLGARIGKAKAVTATARKLAVLFYNTLRYVSTYADPGADYYEQHYKERLRKNLQRRAASLGLQLVEVAPCAV
jgi:transposase